MVQAVAAHDIPFKENQRPPTIHVQAINNGYKRQKQIKYRVILSLLFPQTRDLQRADT